MKAFHITITTESGDRWAYPAIAWSSFDVQTSAFERFGLCATFVRPL